MTIDSRLHHVLFLFFIFFPVLIIAQPTLMINPSSVTFAAVDLGSSSWESVWVSKADPGDPAPVGIQSLNIYPAEFSESFPYTLPYYLDAYDSVEIPLSFNPIMAGTSMGSLVIMDTFGRETIVSLSGTANDHTGPGIPPLQVSPSSWDYGLVAVGDSLMQEFVVSITSAAAYGENGVQGIDCDNPSFNCYSLDYLPTSLGGGTTTLIRATFSPYEEGPQIGQMQIYDMHGGMVTVDLSGTAPAAAPAPNLSLSPLYFSHSMPELSTYNGSIVLRNDGATALNYTIHTDSLPSWLRLGDTDSIGFRNISSSLSPGDSTLVTLRFNSYELEPGNSFTAQIKVVSDNGLNTEEDYCNVNLYVEYLPVRAMFTASSTTPHLGDEVQFDDLSRVSPLSSTYITSWLWDLDGDGSPDSSVQDPLFTYPAAGTYSVGLTVWTMDGHQHTEFKENYITVSNNPPFVSTPLTTVAIDEDSFYQDNFWNIFSEPDGDNLNFYGIKSTHISVVVLEDNNFRIMPQPNWSGTETVRLVATDPWGLTAFNDVTVNVSPVNDPPVLSLPATFYFVKNSHLNVDFAQYVEDVDNNITEISINIIQEAPIQPNVSVSYNAGIPGSLLAIFGSTPGWWGSPATYRITVNDNVGRAVSSGTFQVQVLEHFTVSFSTAPGNYTLAGQIIPFLDQTLGNPDWWEWDFENDGTVDSNNQNPSWYYSNGGTYSVRLRLGNNESGEEGSLLVPNMFTMEGTAVTSDTPAPPVMDPQGSPYNIQGNLLIPEGSEVTVLPDVVLNFLSDEPILLDGEFNANGGIFQPGSGNPNWGGLIFGPGSSGNLNGCFFYDASNPLSITGGNPLLQNLHIGTSSPTGFIDGIGLEILGSSPSISGTVISNYRTGIRLNSSGRTTPTLTNIRVRNSSEGSRPDDSLCGILIEGDCSAILDDVEVEDYNLGIRIINEDRSTSTPTLTNIRVRNSNEGQRNLAVGISISGEVEASLNDVQVIGATDGIVYAASGNSTRTTPTLTNIRVRTSSETQRSFQTGLQISNLSSISLSDIEVEDYSLGILIEAEQNRTLSTPTLTNIRVRNSSETNRTISTGLSIQGSISARISDLETDNCTVGILYDQAGDLSRLSTTPTLTNIRVRNSSEANRNERFGILLNDLGRVVLDDVEIDNCTGALSVQGDLRVLSTPTLTNIRVRNSSESSRFPNYGISLGSGVRGTLENSRIEGAVTGLLILAGNQTKLGINTIKNCATAIVANNLEANRSIAGQTIILDPLFAVEHPEWLFKAFVINASSGIVLKQNTISNYPVLVIANSSNLDFNSNIAWGSSVIGMPFIMDDSSINAMYNNVRRAQEPIPGQGNINIDPIFVDAQSENFQLDSQSPCIDTGDPTLPEDMDGSIADMGAYCYLHKADFVADHIFIQTGSTVNFSNLSWGHNDPQLTQIFWDLGNNGSIDGGTYNWQYTFNQPGLYDLKLKMVTGNLVDEIVIPRAVVVQSELLQPPVLHTISRFGSDIQLDWDPVLYNVEQQPVTVNYYLVYSSLNPKGPFRYLGFTESEQTQFLHIMGANVNSRFYRLIGYIGTREALESYIRTHQNLVDPDIQP